MLSKALSLDLAKYGVRVNCVCPGITDTPMFRLHVNKTADPERTLRRRIDRVPLGALSLREKSQTQFFTFRAKSPQALQAHPLLLMGDIQPHQNGQTT